MICYNLAMILVVLLFIFQTFFGGVAIDFEDFHEVRVSAMMAPASMVRFSEGGFGTQDVQFNVEIADTPAERARGLMFRRKLPQNRGMLFIFEDDNVRNFWMKNTLIPLDMIFADSEGKVVSTRENVPPCVDGTSCPVYSSGTGARYVLEINAGLAQAYDIRPGAQMDIQHM